MKILNVLDEMNPVLGGAPERTYQMSRYLCLAGVNVDLLTTNSHLDRKWVSDLSSGNTFILNAFHFRYLFPIGARKWLDQNISKYDVVHISKNWSLLSSLTAAAAIKHNIPYVFSAMGFVAIHNRSKFLKKIYKKYLTIPMIHGAAACIAVTSEEKDDLIRAGASPEKVHLIPNGIIPENFLHKDDANFRKEFSLGDRKIILFIGRMDPIKGVHLIVEAFARIRNKLDGWCLILVGTQTAYRKQMEQLVDALDLNNSIIFLDPIFGKTKSEAYHASEFIVVPSVKDAMTIVAPEAACCSKAVLITNTSDFSELARHGGAVEVSPTIEELANALELLTDKCFDRIKMGSEGYKFVVENFKWENQIKKYLDLFSSVAGSL
jgi:glycosyltransferase involved in cell wall biosynthesis